MFLFFLVELEPVVVTRCMSSLYSVCSHKQCSEEQKPGKVENKAKYHTEYCYKQNFLNDGSVFNIVFVLWRAVEGTGVANMAEMFINVAMWHHFA